LRRVILGASMQSNTPNSEAAPAARRTAFPPVFFIANAIEVLERFAYYGIYFGFGIYMTQLGYTRDQLGIVQSL
jgi:dipeptide/tripeptide permease